MFLEVPGKLKDQTNILLEPKFAFKKQQPSPHIMVLVSRNKLCDV